MHIPDGILPAAVTIGGYATAAGITALTLRKYKREDIPKVSLLTAAFFVASWIHIPIPPTSVHLVLNGLMGVVLGPMAFPAILIGLFFQAVMFQHGGLTTLGVNATMMGAPALLAYGIFQLRKLFGQGGRISAGIFAFLGGALGLGISALIALALLITTIPTHMDAAAEHSSIIALTLAHVPLMVIEGIFTALVVIFLMRVSPGLINDS